MGKDPNFGDVVVILIGNKCDLQKRVVKDEDIDQWVKKQEE